MVLYRKFIVLFALLLFFNLSFGQLGDVTLLDPVNGDGVPVYQKAEIGISIPPTQTFNNPYDPSEVIYFATVKSPSGKERRVDAFYFLSFTENAQPVAGFRVRWQEEPTRYPFRIRLVLEETGTHEIKVFSSQRGGVSKEIERLTLEGVPSRGSSRKGFIHFPEGKSYLKFSNGDPFFPVGINLSFYGDPDFRLAKGDTGSPGPKQGGSFVYAPSTLDYYRKQIGLAKDNGVNFIRIILAPWTFELEWEGGTGNYDKRQYQLHDLDELFRLCEDNDIYVQLALFDHTAFKEASVVNDPGLSAYCWTNCPYKTEFDLKGPAEFFTHPTAKERFRQRIRYLYARYGYSRNLVVAELISEAQQYPGFWGTEADGFKNNDVKVVHDWHLEMAAFCKSINPRILLTTGAAGFWGVHDAWATKDFDLASPHAYGSYKNQAYLNAHAVQALRKKMAAKGKVTPVQIGESGQGLKFEADGRMIACHEHEITQVHFHNTAWSTAFFGSFGMSIPWSRTELFARWGPKWGRGYRYFMPVRHFFEGEKLYESEWLPLTNKPEFSKTVESVPLCHQGHVEIEENRYRGVDKTVRLNTRIEVSMTNGTAAKDVATFAIKSSDRILGWVQNMGNYWYNLNGNTPKSAGNVHTEKDCIPYVKHPNTDTRPRVKPLRGVQLTFPDLECNGIYDVEWWNTYPEFDADGNADKMENGGQLNNPATLVSVTGTSLPTYAEAEDGRLTIEVPEMAPLSLYDNWQPEKTEFAPDYAYKISYRKGSGTPVSQDWRYEPVEKLDNRSDLPDPKPSVRVKDGQVVFIGPDRFLRLGNPSEPDAAENLKALAPVRPRKAKVGSQGILLSNQGEHATWVFYIDRKGFLHRLNLETKEQYRWKEFRFKEATHADFLVTGEYEVQFRTDEGKVFRYFFNDPCR